MLFKQSKQRLINSVCFIGLNEAHTGLFNYQPVFLTASKTPRRQTFIVIRNENSYWTGKDVTSNRQIVGIVLLKVINDVT
jgi:hypothetical protein